MMQLLLFILAFVCHFHNHNSDVLCSVVGNHFFSLAVIVSFIYLPQGLLLYDNF